MCGTSTRSALFVDYDNLTDNQKREGVAMLARRAMDRAGCPLGARSASCHVRVYGGWYEGQTLTRLAQDLSAELARDFPCRALVAGAAAEHLSTRFTAELAFATLEDPTHHLWSTYRRKRVPTAIRVCKQDDVSCMREDCVLPLLRRALRTGRCSLGGCPCPEEEVVYRAEQKLVDTMLCCDLLYTAAICDDQILLVSDDDDFAPPVRAAALKGRAVTVVHPRPNRQRSGTPVRGKSLHEVDL